ncbi:nuclear transport factor 2 family protein [Lentzea sp. E54]|uniref:nuclear transport factor 2 family protein n=1 Tax=Lentzea xerophila TaxID=3435883 RepID=UPI003DA33CD6
MRPWEVVEEFLAAYGAGRLADAARHLDPAIRMIFPGGREYTNLNELAAVSATRYRFVDKHRDHYDSTGGADAVVFSIGRLYGENLHGVAFDNVRYVDRFVVRDGLIVEQRVWNDLAETGVLNARTAGELDERWRPGGAA